MAIISLSPRNTQLPACMSDVQLVPSLLAFFPLLRSMCVHVLVTSSGAMQALPRELGVGRKGVKWGETVALAVIAPVRGVWKVGVSGSSSTWAGEVCDKDVHCDKA